MELKSEKDKTKLNPDSITESTQSIVLGLLCETYRLINHRTYNHKWDSITISGDIYDDTAPARLHSVEAIQNKFQAVKEYAQQNPKEKHCLIYVNESEFCFDDCPENVFIFHFNLRINAIQYCDYFCHISTLMSHRYQCVPSIVKPLPHPSLPYSSRLFQGTRFGCPASCL